jgi:saccharopine dehydrogenase-like NADP-dependent oxidoreductase
MQGTKKMKAAILGVGRMGTAICYAMNKLGFDVVGIDSCAGAADNFRKHISGPDGAFYLTDGDKTFHQALMFEKPDIVISSLPYHQTEEVGHWCNDNSLRYCDLGGRVDVSQNINEAAKNHGKTPVFTDLGLAPGWVNILAEEGCRQLHRQATTIKMMVGGLPDSKVNHPLDYVVTWSVDGLINEYKDDCKILEDGEIKTVKGMSGLESIECGTLGKLEAFYTSGGASHTIQSMKSKGVSNCYYKTLRYEGHRDIVRFLIENQSEECVREAIERGCQNPDGVDDVVLIKAFVEGENVEWKKELAIWGDSGGFSAMQKATAFSISSVAKIMAEGKLEGNKGEHKDYHTQYPVNLSYADVPFDEFNNNLKLLGII